MSDESIALLRLREQAQADANTLTKLRENLERAFAERDGYAQQIDATLGMLLNIADTLRSRGFPGTFNLEQRVIAMTQALDAARAACAVKDQALTHCHPSNIWDKARMFYSDDGSRPDVIRQWHKERCDQVDAALSSDDQPILDELTRLRSERAESRAECAKLESRLLSEVEERQQVSIEAVALRAQVADLTRERDEARSIVEDATRQSGRSVAEGKSLASIVWSLKKSFDELTRDNAELRKDWERIRVALIEERAMSIYNGLKHQDGWVPWVVGGNSLKQGDCRSVARATIDAALSPKEGSAES